MLSSFCHWKVKARQLFTEFFSGGQDYEPTGSSVDHSHDIGGPVGGYADSRVFDVASIGFSIERPFGMSIYCDPCCQGVLPEGSEIDWSQFSSA